MEDKYSNLQVGVRDEQNAFRYWFEKVKDCGIRVPRTVIFDVPKEILLCFYMEKGDEDYKTVEKWVKSVVNPKLSEENLHGLLFIKNGAFSNKFNAGKACMALESTMTSNIIDVNYTAMEMICGYGQPPAT